MVIGVGFDLSSIAYWKSLLDEGRTLAIEEMFTPAELERARQHPEGPAPRLAARYAAKEAFIKALGASRLHHEPVVQRLDLAELEVRNDALGRPFLELHGRARDAADRLGVRHVWLSLTHEDNMAGAVVVLEG